MVRLFRLMLLLMLTAVGVNNNDEIAALRDLKPPNVAPNLLLHSVMDPSAPDIPPPPPPPPPPPAPLDSGPGGMP